MTTPRDERRRARIEEQRRARRKQRRTRRRIWPAVAVAGAVVLAGAGAAAYVGLRDGPGEATPERAVATRDGSVEVEGAPRVQIERTPASYRVVYRLEEFTGPEVALSTDKVWVRRPFESRLETWRGAPPGEEKVSTQVGAFAIRRNESASAEDPVVIGVPPSAAPSDVRLLPALTDGEAMGLLEPREVRQVLDRECQVYRSGQLLSASRLTKPTTDEYTDSCVDAAGIVLEELLVLDGAIVSRRIATEVEEEPSLDDELFVTGARTLEVADGGGLVRRMGEGLPPGEFLLYDPASIPEGFERLGRFNVIPSQPENFSDPTREGARETSFADVFVRGADFLVIDQGGTLQGVDPFTEDPDAPRMDIGPHGSAELRLSALGIELRAKRSGGRFLRVRGTLDPRQLAAIAAALTPTEGTGPLEFFEEPGS